MGVTVEEREEATLVRLEGTVDLTEAAALKATLLAALDRGRMLSVSLEEAAYLDVTAIQLLKAARREAAKRGLGWEMANEPSRNVSDALVYAGFDRALLAG